MDYYVAPEIPEYAKHIVKKAIGIKAEVTSVEWSAGGLFNKAYTIHTTEGSFILKIECDRIFFSTRKDQIENEVSGNALFQAAGLPCAPILSYDLTKNNIGVRYVFYERITSDILLLTFDQFDDAKKAEIERQEAEVFAKMRKLTSTHFGSLSPTGILGRHETWGDYCRHVFKLMICDGERIGIFTGEEISVMKKASEKAFSYTPPEKVTPSFVHGDLGRHNSIWGSLHNQPDQLYVIDFGNAYYGLPRYDEYVMTRFGGLKLMEDVTADMDSLKPLYENSLIMDFERLWWHETQKLTEDYAHCLDWMSAGIEAAKKDTSRTYITDFVERCRSFL